VCCIFKFPVEEVFTPGSVDGASSPAANSFANNSFANNGRLARLYASAAASFEEEDYQVLVAS
jgi:hypothetical protein